jgi:hypothetical protein
MYKRLVAWIILLSIMFTLGATGASAQISESGIHQEGVYPNYLAIKNTSIYLSISTSGKATCSASLSTWGGYGCGIILDLQQYKNGEWETVKSWTSTSEGMYTSINKEIYVPKGYTYRLKAFFYATQNGDIVDSTTIYSSEKYY